MVFMVSVSPEPHRHLFDSRVQVLMEGEGLLKMVMPVKSEETGGVLWGSVGLSLRRRAQASLFKAMILIITVLTITQRFSSDKNTPLECLIYFAASLALLSSFSLFVSLLLHTPMLHPFHKPRFLLSLSIIVLIMNIYL